ncbi:hypothetical protein [Pseudonocardia sp. GCM10023141]|uniref:hypothetical protein n=1 Tax=Pseudonocardia sp. GCM10023141 TaxID=3252653 RepID=UPI00360688FF
MDNDELVLAIGMDAVAAVQGYRRQVIGEAARRGLNLVDEASLSLRQESADVRITDPIGIRLFFHDAGNRCVLAGRMLRWGPAYGWSLSRIGAQAHLPFSYYAGHGGSALDLVPTASELLDWVSREPDRASDHGAGKRAYVDLDADWSAVRRLMGFAGA